MIPEPVLELRAINVKYGQTRILRNISLSVQPGERVAVMGPSGSGKSTLLHAALCLVRPQSGAIFFAGDELSGKPDGELSKWRRTKVGVIFQFGHLIQEMTLLENIQMPLWVTGTDRKMAKLAAEDLITRFGLGHLARRFPSEVSGGELQRVAVARAAVHRPRLIVADEPTGALDTNSGRAVLDLLVEVTGSSTGASLIMVTHDKEVAAYADRVVIVRDGRTQSISPDAGAQ